MAKGDELACSSLLPGNEREIVIGIAFTKPNKVEIFHEPSVERSDFNFFGKKEGYVDSDHSPSGMRVSKML
jgi:hypothetical protein